MGTGNRDFHGNLWVGAGKSMFLRESFGCDHGNDVGTGTGVNPSSRESLELFWMGTGNQDFHGNLRVGTGKSLFLRELFGCDHGKDIDTGTGININSREMKIAVFLPREFSRGLP